MNLIGKTLLLFLINLPSNPLGNSINSQSVGSEGNVLCKCHPAGKTLSSIFINLFLSLLFVFLVQLIESQNKLLPGMFVRISLLRFVRLRKSHVLIWLLFSFSFFPSDISRASHIRTGNRKTAAATIHPRRGREYRSTFEQRSPWKMWMERPGRGRSALSGISYLRCIIPNYHRSSQTNDVRTSTDIFYIHPPDLVRIGWKVWEKSADRHVIREEFDLTEQSLPSECSRNQLE